MIKTISIYEAKTNLSKLVKRAEAGETIYIGAYGSPQAVIMPIPEKAQLRIGIWDKKCIPGAYKDSDLIEPDKEVQEMFESSVAGKLL